MEKATSSHAAWRCVEWTSRSLRPHARGEVLCAEPGRPHAARSRAERSRASRGSSKERSPAGRHEESDDCIVPRKPRTKPSDIGGGDGGGKAVGRRKGTSLRMSRTQSRNWHVTEAARPRIGAAWAAQAPMADHVRPSTGARCVSSARRDLCGGERGNPPPTATHREPCEARVSRTVLGAPGGEIPPGDSTGHLGNQLARIIHEL
jgi:hypothetical protein